MNNTTKEWAATCGPNDGNYFRIENWLPLLSKYTFATSQLSLTPDEARILAKFRENIRLQMQYEGFKKRETNKNHLIGSDFNAEYFDTIEERVKTLLTAEEKEKLAVFTKRLDDAIVPLTKNGNGVFVKLSTRSPKDAGIFGHNMKKILVDEIRKLVKPGMSDTERKIREIIAYTRTASYTLRVTSGAEAIRLLVRSQRVFTDISFALLMGGDKFDLQIIFREWCPDILPEWEFRAFVWNRKLTCCTQYYSHCFVPEMAQNKEKVSKTITDFIEKEVIPKLPAELTNLTVDLALSPDLTRVWVVEIGNPPPVAGTALYNWDIQADQDIMTGKNPELPFELRILDKLPEGYWESQHSSVLEVMRQERGISQKFTSKHVCYALVAVVVAVAVGLWMYRN